MLCILYVNAVGILLGIAGILTERALPAAFSRRWVWCIIIPVSVFLPGYYRWHHNWSVVQGLQQPAMRAASYDTTIQQVWLTLSVMLLLWGVANAWRVARVLHLARRGQGDAAGRAVVDGIPVVVTDLVGPATVGLWRSHLLVPRWVLAMPKSQRQYVLRHEEEHRSAHDAQLLFVASLTLLLMPWNLAMWWQLRRLCLAVEMDCDNRVVNGLGNAPAYGALLLKVAEASSRGPRLQPALLGGMGSLEHRLTVLLAPTPLRQVQQFLLPVAVLALVFAVLVMPHPVLGSGHAHSATGQLAQGVNVPSR
jgi:beta-lactamase regulating signal transducer with metallopeptidase domain